MKSSYVQSSFLEIASGDKTDRLRIVDIGSGGRCRIFQARFMPASYGVGSGGDDDPGAGMDVLSGLTGPRVYGCYSEPYRIDSHNRVGGLFFLDISVRNKRFYFLFTDFFRYFVEFFYTGGEIL